MDQFFSLARDIQFADDNKLEPGISYGIHQKKENNMNKSFSLLITIALFHNSLHGQITDIVKSDSISSILHQENIGKITFMSKPIPLEEYKATDFLDYYEIKEKGDLNIRTFLGNSLTNYLHLLSPEMPADELTQNGNYQFTFYIDSFVVYTENLNPGAGSAQNKNTKTVFRVPLISSTDEDSWGRFLWNRFMMKGGQDALSSGIHLLKIEIRPYLNSSTLLVGNKIAEGTIRLKISQKEEKYIPENLLAIQKINATADWEIASEEPNHEKIRELNKKILTEEFKDITSVVVIKDGKLILEEYFNGSNRNSLHDTRSVGKSFASTLTGFAIRDGYLQNENQKLGTFYPLKTFSNYSTQKENISIKDLLTMSSSFDGSDRNDQSPGNEENMYPTANWVTFTLNLPTDSLKQNGKQWDYFTAGVILIGDILHKSIPEGLQKYAERTLFNPMEIANYEWQYTPQKVVNTAGGIKMNSLDLAKFGQLYKNSGLWKGRQIIPQNWVDQSLSHHIKIPDTENEYYGYLFWNKCYISENNKYEAYYCSGNGGNKIIIFKNDPLVIVITSTAYNKSYGHYQADKIVENYLLPSFVRSKIIKK